MSSTKLPTEVELIYEIMPCNAMRSAQEPTARRHPCSYFRAWGSYHSYDYAEDGPPPSPGITHDARYMGRAHLVPEALSGCRKAPIMSVGINPNLPGWWPWKRSSLSPLFDDYKQFAHYFRYRAVAKLEIPRADYERFGGGDHDGPFSSFELNVPVDEDGSRLVLTRLQPQAMYQAYQGLLDALAQEMGWTDHGLSVGEDLSYGNMVACPSAKWTTKPVPDDPKLPPMTLEERDGIVTECFHERKYFLRQLFQSLPAVLLCFSQSTANALIGELASRFVLGDPKIGEPLSELMKREVRFRYGDLADGTPLEGRVIFAPHITGNPGEFEPAQRRVVEQLAEEARAGNLTLSPATGHLTRPRGACVFCTTLEIGPCDYEAELKPLSQQPVLTAASPTTSIVADKRVHLALMRDPLAPPRPIAEVWSNTDDLDNERPLAQESSNDIRRLF